MPSWAKALSVSYKMINTRAATVAEKPAFRQWRWLVPTSGFYERKREVAAKQPYFIRLKEDGPCARAGLYEQWEDAEGHVLLSYTIVTTEANDFMRPIHDRMRGILRREDEGAWPDSENGAIGAHPVTGAVNRAGNDNSSLIVSLLR